MMYNATTIYIAPIDKPTNKQIFAKTCLNRSQFLVWLFNSKVKKDISTLILHIGVHRNLYYIEQYQIHVNENKI
jgi:hypothetical protein